MDSARAVELNAADFEAAFDVSANANVDVDADVEEQIGSLRFQRQDYRRKRERHGSLAKNIDAIVPQFSRASRRASLARLNRHPGYQRAAFPHQPSEDRKSKNILSLVLGGTPRDMALTNALAGQVKAVDPTAMGVTSFNDGSFGGSFPNYGASVFSQYQGSEMTIAVLGNSFWNNTHHAVRMDFMT